MKEFLNGLENQPIENTETHNKGTGCGTAIIVAILVYREVIIATNEPGLAWLFTIAAAIIIIGLD